MRAASGFRLDYSAGPMTRGNTRGDTRPPSSTTTKGRHLSMLLRLSRRHFVFFIVFDGNTVGYADRFGGSARELTHKSTVACSPGVYYRK